VYLASMSSDRSVRIYPRKAPTKNKKKVLRQVNTMTSCSLPPEEHLRMVETLLNESKFELTKSKQLKYRHTQTPDKIQKQHLFADESTMQSFVRRLAWTADGSHLIAPACMWQANENEQLQFATLLWARHKFDEPCRVLLGFDKVRFTFAVLSVVFDW
jgi:hypothetical protein